MYEAFHQAYRKMRPLPMGELNVWESRLWQSISLPSGSLFALWVLVWKRLRQDSRQAGRLRECLSALFWQLSLCCRWSPGGKGLPVSPVSTEVEKGPGAPIRVGRARVSREESGRSGFLTDPGAQGAACYSCSFWHKFAWTINGGKLLTKQLF